MSVGMYVCMCVCLSAYSSHILYVSIYTNMQIHRVKEKERRRMQARCREERRVEEGEEEKEEEEE